MMSRRITNTNERKFWPALAAGAIGFLVVLASPADAFEIHIDPDGYPGRWRIHDLDWVAGPGRVELAQGEYDFHLRSVAPRYVRITVDEFGVVDSTDHSLVYPVEGRTDALKLRTFQVGVNVARYPGRWLSGADGLASSRHRGDQTLTLAAATYTFRLYGVPNSSADYTVDDEGEVSTESRKITAEGTQLTLKTYPISVNVGGYQGRWVSGSDGGASVHEGDIDNLMLGPGTYTFRLYGVRDSSTAYTVENEGEVSPSNERIIRAVGRQLTLQTHPISVNVGGYHGRWISGSDGGAPVHEGDIDNLMLAPGTYTFRLRGVADSSTEYTIEDDGSILLGREAERRLEVFRGRTLVLRTLRVDIKLQGYRGRWRPGVDYPTDFLLEGDNWFDLGAGTYEFDLINVAGNYFQYRIEPEPADDGLRVRVLDDPDGPDGRKATASDGRLELKTHAVEFDVDGLTTQWRWPLRRCQSEQRDLQLLGLRPPGSRVVPRGTPGIFPPLRAGWADDLG